MDRLSGVLRLSRLETVISGPGQIRALGAEAASRNLNRVLVVTGRTLGASPLLDQVSGSLGERCAGVFAGIGEHAPAANVRALIEEVRRVQADALVSFGGSSVADAVKITVASVLADRDLTREATKVSYDDTDIKPNGRLLANIVVPTTLSAGEYSFGAATTDDQGRKGSIIDPRIGAVVAIHDPELTLATPDRLWLSSGIKCLDHAVEAIYSAHSDSLTDALASNALRLLLKHLPFSTTTQGAARLEHRGHCQTAAFMSNYAAYNTRYGLSHATGHKIGPRWHVPHGITSCVSLPSGMRFMAEAAPRRFGLLADVLGVDSSLTEHTRAFACADRIEQFIRGLGLPTRLRELNVDKTELDEVVPALHAQMSLAGTIGRPVTMEEMSSVVHACW
jgi:alcohol dehydrogenase class IV